MSYINARSPYFITVSEPNLTSATLDIYIYTGSQTSSRGSITYSLDVKSIDNTSTFEISELVRDYLVNDFSGAYTCNNVWVDYQVTEYISDAVQTPNAFVQLGAFDGYGYFTEGANPQNDTSLLQINTIMYVPSGGIVTVAINQDNTEYVRFYKDGDVISTTNITPSDDNDDMIRYVSETDVDTIDVYENPTTKTIKVVNIDECKYEPLKVTFVNKFGALQNIYFFKRSNLSLDVKSKNYKVNTLVNDTYSVSKHQRKNLSRSGVQKLTLNSGFVDESFNEVFKQLLLSQDVWIKYNNLTLPILITDNSFSFKTRLNDKLISYTIACEFAFDEINNVR